MSFRNCLSFVAVAVLTTGVLGSQSATAESGAHFEYDGLPGHMTIEQAQAHDGHTLVCEPDEDVAALVRCADLSTEYLGRPAILTLEFIDGHLAQLNVLIPAEFFLELRKSALAQYGKPRRDGVETDGPKPYSHMEWTLADGELVIDEWVARFNPADRRFAHVSGLRFLPSALDKRRAEVFWKRKKVMEERSEAEHL